MFYTLNVKVIDNFVTTKRQIVKIKILSFENFRSFHALNILYYFNNKHFWDFSYFIFAVRLLSTTRLQTVKLNSLAPAKQSMSLARLSKLDSLHGWEAHLTTQMAVLRFSIITHRHRVDRTIISHHFSLLFNANLLIYDVY